MIVCVCTVCTVSMTRTKKTIIKLKHASPSPFGISWKVARRPVRFSFFLFFYSVREEGKQAITRRIGTLGS